MHEKFAPGTSRWPRTPRTLLLRMAQDEERAGRIRDLKQAHPGLRWQAIADHVGVTMRAAQSWQEKGEISYENAKKLAELFDVDVDFIMRGVQGPTQDPFPTEVDINVESTLAGVLAEIKAQLAEQTQVLKEIKAMLAEQQQLKAETDDLWPLMRAVLDGIPLPQEAEPAPPEGPPRSAPAGT